VCVCCTTHVMSICIIYTRSYLHTPCTTWQHDTLHSCNHVTTSSPMPSLVSSISPQPCIPNQPLPHTQPHVTAYNKHFRAPNRHHSTECPNYHFCSPTHQPCIPNLPQAHTSTNATAYNQHFHAPNRHRSINCRERQDPPPQTPPHSHLPPTPTIFTQTATLLSVPILNPTTSCTTFQ